MADDGAEPDEFLYKVLVVGEVSNASRSEALSQPRSALERGAGGGWR